MTKGINNGSHKIEGIGDDFIPKIVDKNLIDKILVKNPKTSFFYHSFIDNIEAAAVRRISPLQSNIKSEMPIDLIARWYARSVILIFEYVYVDHNKCTRKEMFDYIRKFIS